MPQLNNLTFIIMNTEPKHTPGTWKQGRLLLTTITRLWTKEAKEFSDKAERLRVYANFNSKDEGRSRQLICICQTEEDAKLIAAAPELLEACEEALKELRYHNWQNTATYNKIESAIKKATE